MGNPAVSKPGESKKGVAMVETLGVGMAAGTVVGALGTGAWKLTDSLEARADV